MIELKGIGFAALLCLPCLVVALGVSGALAAAAGALLTPAVGIPLIGFGVILVAFAPVLWRRRRACDLPPAGAGRRRARRSARSSPTLPLGADTHASRAEAAAGKRDPHDRPHA